MKLLPRAPKVNTARMTAQVVKFILHNCGVHREISTAVIRSFIAFITHELQQGRRVQIGNLGTFALRHEKGRVVKVSNATIIGKGRTFSRGTITRVYPEADRVHFKASQKLTDKVWEVRKPIYQTKI